MHEIDIRLLCLYCLHTLTGLLQPSIPPNQLLFGDPIFLIKVVSLFSSAYPDTV